MKIHHYSFGSPMPGRNFSNGNYRFGFNGKENDSETVGTGIGTQDYGMRIYNPSLGKFLSVDPLKDKYPELSTYQFASDNPIKYIDLDGLESHDPPPPAETFGFHLKFDIVKDFNFKDNFSVGLGFQRAFGEQGSLSINLTNETTTKRFAFSTYANINGKVPFTIGTTVDFSGKILLFGSESKELNVRERPTMPGLVNYKVGSYSVPFLGKVPNTTNSYNNDEVAKKIGEDVGNLATTNGNSEDTKFSINLRTGVFGGKYGDKVQEKVVPIVKKNFLVLSKNIKDTQYIIKELRDLKSHMIK